MCIGLVCSLAGLLKEILNTVSAYDGYCKECQGQTAVKPSKGRLLCKGTAKEHLCSAIQFRNQDVTLH